MSNYAKQLKKVMYSLELSKAKYLQPSHSYQSKAFIHIKKKKEMKFLGYCVPKEMWSYDIVHNYLKCYYRQKSISQLMLSNLLKKEKVVNSTLKVQRLRRRQQSAKIQ